MSQKVKGRPPTEEENWPFMVLVCASTCEQIGIMRYTRMRFAVDAARKMSAGTSHSYHVFGSTGKLRCVYRNGFGTKQ